MKKGRIDKWDKDLKNKLLEEFKNVLNINLPSGSKAVIRKFQDGDRVEVKGYGSICQIDGVDKFLTDITGQIHYRLISEDYLYNKVKTNNSDPASEDELKLIENEK